MHMYVCKTCVHHFNENIFMQIRAFIIYILHYEANSDDLFYPNEIQKYCCIFGFLKYTHTMCWWRIAISTGASHLHASFSLNPITDKR